VNHSALWHRACGGRHLRPGYDYYVCPSKTQRRALVAQERCRARYIPARQLEDLVWRGLCQVLQHSQMDAQRWNEPAVASGCHRSCKPVAPLCDVVGLLSGTSAIS
jgi:hypothetical protein